MNMYTGSLVLATILALLGATQAQVRSMGACPSGVNVVPDFDVAQYLGTWYEYAKYPFISEAGGKCIKAQYDLQQDGNVCVVNTMINDVTDSMSDIQGFAKLVENGKLMVTFPVSPVYNVTSNYWVLGTDYSQYSVVYSCQPQGMSQHSTMAWILTRERQPSTDVINRAECVLRENSVSLTELTITDQTGCPAN